MSVLALRMKQRREYLKMTQEELASLLGTTQKQISRYETAENFPNADVLIALAKALHTTPDWLLGFEDDLTPEERTLLEIYRAKDTEHKRKLVEIARVV